MIKKLYRKCVSESLRHKIYDLFLGQILLNFEQFPYWSKGLFTYLFSPFFPKNEYYDAYRFVGKHGVTAYPFNASLKYKNITIPVLYDENMPYVIHNGKKLYFSNQMTERQIGKLYRSLLIEQDEESAHRYVKSYDELQGKTLLDIGAAEGIFTLDSIEYVKKAFLFEGDDKWIESLKKTFEPWREKVEIIKKYVSDSNSDEYISLDSFMAEKDQNNIYIKMDIEGMELSALKGARKILGGGVNVSFSVCTYHNKDDAKEISSFFESLGYSYEFTKGYLSMRKAICRGDLRKN